MARKQNTTIKKRPPKKKTKGKSRKKPDNNKKTPTKLKDTQLSTSEVDRPLIPERDPVHRVPIFPKFYATNVIGGLTEFDFRFEILNEKIDTDTGWEFVSDGLIILNYRAMKKLYILLDKSIRFYEAKHGEIKLESVPISQEQSY